MAKNLLQVSEQLLMLKLKPPSSTITHQQKQKQKQIQIQSCLNRRQFISQTNMAASSVSISLLLRVLVPEAAAAAAKSQQREDEEDSLSDWERVYLPIDPGVVLLDIAFVPGDFNHGSYFFLCYNRFPNQIPISCWHVVVYLFKVLYWGLAKPFWRPKMVETLGFRVPFPQPKMKISTTDSIPSASKERRDGLLANLLFFCTLPMPGTPGKGYL